MLLGRGAQPYRVAVRQQQIEGGGLGHQPARRGQHHFRVDLHGLFQRPPFVAAVGIGAVQIVDFQDAAAGHALDLAVQLHERITQVISQHLAQRGLARAAQADQRHALGAVGALRPRPYAEQLGQGLARALQVGFRAAAEQLADQQPVGRFGGDVAHQFGQRAVEGACDLQQHQDGGIAHPMFQIGQMALRYASHLRQALAGHAAYGPQAAHPLAQGHQERFPPGFGWRRI